MTVQPDFGGGMVGSWTGAKAMLDDAGAFAAFQRAVELNPENAVSQYRLGAEHLRQGNAHEAVKHLRKSFQLDPGNQSTLNSLQLALRQDGQVDEAGEIKRSWRRRCVTSTGTATIAFDALRLNNEGAALEKAGNLPAARKSTALPSPLIRNMSESART